jgi:hypothetical protein
MNPNNIATKRTRFAALLLTAAALLSQVGCSKDSTGPKRVPLTLQAQGVGSASQEYAAARAIVPSSSGSAIEDTVPVLLTRALLVVRDIRFQLPDGDNGADSLDLGDFTRFGDDDGGGQIRFMGPYVVDLLAGTAQNLGTQMVPPGTYTKVMGHLQSLGGGEPFAAQYPDLVGSTILLEGDIAGDGGGHFLYVSRIDTEFVAHGLFVVDDDVPATSYLVFDLRQLLMSDDGQFLDPRNPDNAQLIEQAIRHATKIGMDRDHAGDPDDLVDLDD